MTLCVGFLNASSLNTLVRHKRDWIIDEFDIEEEHPGPFPFVLGKINIEENMSIDYKIEGEGITENPKGTFSIDTKTRQVWVNKKLDYEEYKILKFTFEAYDTAEKKTNTRLGVEVKVMDINDNIPTFDKQTYTVNLKESASQETILLSVKALDKDDSSTKNGTFDLRIVSVTPDPTDLEFYLQQSGTINYKVGTIKFKGCLDHEKAENYTILVEAKDRGEKVQLSSTTTVLVTIEDENNHQIVFTGQTGLGKVKENEENIPVLRLQVSDLDTRGTDAWKALYTIHGDTGNNFRITTDPQTNEGVLFLVKALDFEKASVRNLSVSVTNVAPYQTCMVKSRPATGVWDVVTAKEVPGVRHMMVTVEDVNDPPFFSPAVKNVTVDENMPVGWTLETFTALDLDRSYSNDFRYIKGEDPNDWVTVDSKSGKITTAKMLDREGSNVTNGHYKVTLYAVDSGKPPMTGTGTLNIQLNDLNDNAPLLEKTRLDLCLSDSASATNITAKDLDTDPYSGPFYFELEGDVSGKWRIDPDNGYTVNLVKETTVYAGIYTLQLRVSDLQGLSAVHKLSVTVCECSLTRQCGHRGATQKGSEGSIGIIFAAMLLLLGFLLLAFTLSCKDGKKLLPVDEQSGALIHSNFEAPGTDCGVPLHGHQVPVIKRTVDKTAGWNNNQTEGIKVKVSKGDTSHHSSLHQREFQHFQHSSKTSAHECHLSPDQSKLTRKTSHIKSFNLAHYMVLQPVLNTRMLELQTPMKELGDYPPHPYADEGDLETGYQLDAIPIPETPFDIDTLEHLGPGFRMLASICNPDLLHSF